MPKAAAKPAKKSSPKKAAKPVAKKAAASPKKKATRAKKDPNAPKRGASAYMLWLKDNRSRITKPGMSVIDVSKQAGVEWNAVKDKSKWEKAAAEDKKRYEKEMAAYKGGASPAKKAAKKTAKK
ncbi:hypothetical protein PRIPAC_82034 [Pristionchus pacificus]|uniref:HMG box domain-containing protein n=1 Tax=Pristionchus pacificus TaxID=54126 RepID=A0A2A6CC63_PRIPA|nr:hypothetical protein PRIPAC_82034 [Pristionchus pacificus]|eukprot:PDM75633.1 hypothetical protein PRIPAC_42810 [Pristionchus pacificus]